MAIQRNVVAAYYHARMAVDNRFGYTQGPDRWGGNGPLEIWECQGVLGQFIIGGRDCSSSVIDCWAEALRGSKWEGVLNGATYTGNIRSVFVASGLFDWHPMGDGYIAQKGDIYLNETTHTAMCQNAIPDTLSEAVINEFGGIVGGQDGDQTGWEFVTDKPYYDFPWDGILAYNHAADEVDEPDIPASWPLQIFESNGSDAQRFTMDKTSVGTMFVCKADGRAIDVAGAEPKDGSTVFLYTPHGNANQRWNLVAKDNGSVEIVSAMDSSKCLDVVGGSDEKGAGLCLWERHGGTNQEWLILQNRDDTVTIINNGASRKLVLDCVNFGR